MPFATSYAPPAVRRQPAKAPTERRTRRRPHARPQSANWRAVVAEVEAMVCVADLHDGYTGGHQRRVADLCVAIGAELGFSAFRQEGLRLGALVHDLGKVAVPADLLAKPGALTEAEFTLIKAHPRTGHDVLARRAFPWPLATMVLQHHERMDGSGYPCGLRGEAILLEARIIAVADVVEAMTLDRPYRAALGLDAALAELEQGCGERYDAQVVEACLRIFAQGRFSF